MQKSVSKTILIAARSTVTRFPFVLLCATTGTILLVIAAGLPQIDDDLHRTLFRMVMSLYLGMLAGISATVFCERNKINKWKEYLLNLVLVLLMLLYYYSLPAILGYVVQTRFILLVIACHACVAFAPFITSNMPNAFWQYNKQLFLRILTSAFYSLALFVGLSLAILAIDNLFALHIDDIIYGKLFIMVVGIFNTFFFLTGIPNDIESLELETNFPKGLKIFTQFILLPLVTLYLLILYTYELKIIVTQVWPVGWVSYLVLGFSIAGMLALLLVWPLRNNEKQRWIKTFTHYFYIALLPLIALLFVAIGKRVMQYGVTEDRYFIIILAIWLLIIDV